MCANNEWRCFGRPTMHVSEEEITILKSTCRAEIKNVKSYPKAHFIGMNITTLSYNRSSSRNDYTITYKVDGGRKLYAFIEKIVTCCTSTCSNQSSSHVGCCQLLLVEPLIEASDKISTDDITDATLPHLKRILLAR